MGSIVYLFDKISKEITVKITPDEAKYILTCECPKGYPYYSKILEMKKKLEEAVNKNTPIKLKAYELLRPYPTLTEKIIYERKPILEYFESMENFGHNPTLVKKLVRIIKVHPELKSKKVFEDLVEHAYNCTVQLGKYEDGRILIWSPSGLKEEKVDTTYIRNLNEECYFTTHGRNKDGFRFAIRIIEDKQIVEGLKKLENLWKALR